MLGKNHHAFVAAVGRAAGKGETLQTARAQQGVAEWEVPSQLEAAQEPAAACLLPPEGSS